MPQYGYHASHEQFAPSELLQLAKRAADAGFDTAMCSDHFHPWSETQGHSGHSWSWLGAALATTPLAYGVVTAPIGRQHPALVAQSAATLAEMFPGRFWMAAGSGEALNDCITGTRWPSKPERNARLLEAVTVMRALWRGEEVDHAGTFRVQRARLYSLPATPPPVYVAALSEETARWAGAWADGLITVNLPHDTLRSLLDSFRDGGGAGKPACLQVKVSYDQDDAGALSGAYRQWRTNVFGSDVSAALRLPSQYEAAARFVRPEDMHDFVRISSDLGQHAAWLHEYAALGFDRVYLHNVNREQVRFIDAFGELLPQLR